MQPIVECCDGLVAARFERIGGKPVQIRHGPATVFGEKLGQCHLETGKAPRFVAMTSQKP